jgi:hypothetical protein
MTDTTTQRAAWALGLGGLIPFLAFALLSAAGPEGWRGFAFSALVAYGAAILAFLGAVHWGLALNAPESERAAGPARLALGVLPALWAWVALLLPEAWRAPALVLGLLATLGVEQWAAATRKLVPANYMLLRWVLTMGACLALLIGGV